MPLEFLHIGHPVGLVIAVLAAAAMGYAIQHGGTCTVAAVGQLVSERRAGRAVALIECSLWVLALGLVTLAAGFRFNASPAYPATAAVLIGGLLLGVGAWINDACVFGSIARIGKRDRHYLLTPPGYFLGSLIHAEFAGPFAPSSPAAPAAGSATTFLLLLFAGSLLISIRQVLAARRSRTPLATIWDYRHATIAIGIAFVILAVIAGPWTYTEVLGNAAHASGLPRGADALLFAALLGGAMFGGRRIAKAAPFAPRRALACLAGGALMGFGGSLVPGGNDNLILAGLPWLQPHAWLAIGAMALAIAAGLIGSSGARRLRLSESVGRTGPA